MMFDMDSCSVTRMIVTMQLYLLLVRKIVNKKMFLLVSFFINDGDWGFFGEKRKSDPLCELKL